MDNIFYVFSIILRFANTTLRFPPFSFTILQFFTCFFIASIVVNFIRKIFD